VKTACGVAPCPCQRERRIGWELPPRYRTARLEDCLEQVKTEVNRWLNCPGDGLFITGTVGTGKTHLACCIVRRKMEGGSLALFRRCAEFYSLLRETFRNNSSESAVMKPLLTAPLLALDDVGSGSLSDHERRSTLEVLDQRSNALLPTIVTSNLSLQKISELLDDRISSRLAAFTAIELQGRDRRLRQ
jgi:DNA replication protein DnaC